MAIVKYITDKGEEVELQEPKKFEEIEGESWSERFLRRKKCVSPIKYFEESILNEISESTTIEYAIDNFNLVSEDEVEDKKIEDFSDSEIEEEYFSNIKLGFTVVTQSFVSRFFKVIEKGDPTEIEEFLNQQELKNNIV